MSRFTAQQGDDAFDSKRGTDTARTMPLWKLNIKSPSARFGWQYETSDPKELENCLKWIPEDPRNLTFIDLGCGKGRVLIVARDIGFRKLIGIEFAPELLRIARLNLAKSGISDAILINADASEYAFPGEDFLAYFFNPFSAEIMTKVLKNMQNAPYKKGYIIYNNARCADLLDSSAFLTRIATVPRTRFPTIIWSVRPSVN